MLVVVEAFGRSTKAMNYPCLSQCIIGFNMHQRHRFKLLVQQAAKSKFPIFPRPKQIPVLGLHLSSLSLPTKAFFFIYLPFFFKSNRP